MAVSLVLKNGVKFVGRMVTDELTFGVVGENLHYGMPIDPEFAVAYPWGDHLVALMWMLLPKLCRLCLGTDTIGCVGILASYCSVFGFGPSHGAVSTIEVLTNSQSLDTVGLFACDPPTLRRVGHILLQSSSTTLRQQRRFIFAEDCFQFQGFQSRNL